MDVGNKYHSSTSKQYIQAAQWFLGNLHLLNLRQTSSAIDNLDVLRDFYMFSYLLSMLSHLLLLKVQGVSKELI